MANPKKLFAIIAVRNPEQLSARLNSEFSDAFLKVAEGQWLVVGDATMTTTELSHKLHITSDEDTPPADTPGPAIVLSVANYYGRTARTTWEWISAKLGGNDGVAG